jgi:hypothetical protein
LDGLCGDCLQVEADWCLEYIFGLGDSETDTLNTMCLICFDGGFVSDLPEAVLVGN